jgi:hypothetical protein
MRVRRVGVWDTGLVAFVMKVAQRAEGVGLGVDRQVSLPLNHPGCSWRDHGRLAVGRPPH